MRTFYCFEPQKKEQRIKVVLLQISKEFHIFYLKNTCKTEELLLMYNTFEMKPVYLETHDRCRPKEQRSHILIVKLKALMLFVLTRSGLHQNPTELLTECYSTTEKTCSLLSKQSKICNISVASPLEKRCSSSLFSGH